MESVTNAGIEEFKKLRIVGVPVRVFERDGRITWSKVDGEMRDLTVENSDGVLYHIRSVFVPHGEQFPPFVLPN